MGFQLCDPTQPRGWVAVLNESLGYLKDRVDATDVQAQEAVQEALNAASRAALAAEQAEAVVLALTERVNRLEARLNRSDLTL